MVEGFDGERSWTQGGTKFQSVVTNTDEAAGRRHQPAFLLLPARDMKRGICSKMEICCSGSLEDGKVAISIGRKLLGTA